MPVTEGSDSLITQVYLPEIKIAETVLGADGQISFSNLPQNFQDLHIVINSKSKLTSDQACRVQFNGDTSTSYKVAIDNQSFTAESSAWLGADLRVGYALNAIDCRILGYAASDRVKTYVGASSWAGDTVNTAVIGGHWNKTAPITSIQFLDTGGGFAAGSRVTVYGVGGVVGPTLGLPAQWTKLQEATLAANGIIDFTGIPQTYSHLKVMGSVRQGAGAQIGVVLNGGAGVQAYDNMTAQWQYGTGVAARGAALNQGRGFCGDTTADQNPAGPGYSNIELTINDYARVGNGKHIVTKNWGGGDDSPYMADHISRIYEMGAVTALRFSHFDGSAFGVGTHLTLYGLP